MSTTDLQKSFVVQWWRDCAPGVVLACGSCAEAEDVVREAVALGGAYGGWLTVHAGAPASVAFSPEFVDAVDDADPPVWRGGVGCRTA